MNENEKRVAENIKQILPRLSQRDREIFVAYGEGMACKAARMTRGSDPEQRRE